MLHTPGDDDGGEVELDFDGDDPDPEPQPGLPADEVDEVDEVDDCAPLDPALEQVGYELFEWDATELDLLDDELHDRGIPHEWVSDGMELVVHEEDEATIDALLPQVRFPDEIAAEPDDGDDTGSEVLGALFLASDRLLRDAHGDGVGLLLDAAERIESDPPYGVEADKWERVTQAVDALLDCFHGDRPPEEIREAAAMLRSRVRPLV